MQVDTYILHGSGLKTVESFEFKANFVKGEAPAYPSKILYGDGDGTVNLRSLLQRPAEEWAPRHHELGYVLDIIEFKGTSHFDMLSSPAVLTKTLQILGEFKKVETE